MKIHELYEQLLDERLTEDAILINSHAPWMAKVICEVYHNAAFKKLPNDLKEEIETIVAAVE